MCHCRCRGDGKDDSRLWEARHLPPGGSSMPTVVRRGQAAIVSYEADVTGAAAGDNDALRIALFAPVTEGTTIFVTDRNWNGTAFAAAGGGDGTLTIAAPVGGYAAGTVLTFTRAQLTAAGISHSNGGDTLYV